MNTILVGLGIAVAGLIIAAIGIIIALSSPE